MRDPIDVFGAEEEFANEGKVWSKKKMKKLINVFVFSSWTGYDNTIDN